MATSGSGGVNTGRTASFAGAGTKASVKVLGRAPWRVSIAAIGIGLLGIAIYGEVTGMRAAERVPESALRFENDLVLSAEETLERLGRRPNESDADFVTRATRTIQAGLAHLDRWYEHDPALYNQLVPFAENPLLNLLGRFSGLPQIERYHFSDYRRTLERGIGLCGDHAIVLSGVLDENGIENVLLSARGGGHVVVEVADSSDARGVYDADFGVSLPGLTQYSLTDPRVVDAYGAAGYSAGELRTIEKIYSQGFSEFDGVYDFMAKRYVFERMSYALKWLLPVLLIALALWSATARARRT